MSYRPLSQINIPCQEPLTPLFAAPRMRPKVKRLQICLRKRELLAALPTHRAGREMGVRAVAEEGEDKGSVVGVGLVHVVGGFVGLGG